MRHSGVSEFVLCCAVMTQPVLEPAEGPPERERVQQAALCSSPRSDRPACRAKGAAGWAAGPGQLRGQRRLGQGRSRPQGRGTEGKAAAPLPGECPCPLWIPPFPAGPTHELLSGSSGGDSWGRRAPVGGRRQPGTLRPKSQLDGAGLPRHSHRGQSPPHCIPKWAKPSAPPG